MKGERRFHVYALLDPRRPGRFEYGKYVFDYEPFYIGKGTGGRATAHSRSVLKNKQHAYNKTKRGRIRKIIADTGGEPIVVILHKNLLEASAYRRETKLIDLVGRVIVRKGPLLNMAEGGLGGLGVPRKPASASLKRRLSRTSTEAWERMPDEAKAKRETKWRDSIASRSKRKQRRVTKQCTASANARWENATPAQVKEFKAKVGNSMRERHANQSPEEKIRFSLKRAAGLKAKYLGIGDREKERIRPLIGAYIDSMRMAPPDEMRALVYRKMTRLAA